MESAGDMNPWPINNPGPCRPNLSRIDGSQHQWVEPRPSPEAVLEGSVSRGRQVARSRLARPDAHEGSGTPVRSPGLNRPPLGRPGRTPCRASTDGSKPRATKPCFGWAPAATSSPTTAPAATADWPDTGAMSRRPERAHPSWSATAWTFRASRPGSRRSSRPSGCSSGRPRSSPASAPRGSVCWRPSSGPPPRVWLLS